MSTQMPALTADDFATMLVSLFPTPWTGDDAKVANGVLYAIMQAFAADYVTIEEQLQYAFDACRIATAQDQALDRVANDFFGTIIGFPEILVRQNGESDASFRQRINSSLLLDACTRPAIIQVLKLFTGATPRVVEPFDPTDTGTYDTNVSYYDYDTVANPARYGDTLPFQFFVESQLPPYQGSNLPIFGYDQGLAYDALSTSAGYYLDPSPSWFSGATELDSLLNRTKALGTTIWRRYNSQALVTNPRSQTIPIPAGSTNYNVSLTPPSAGAYSVLALPSWNTGVSWTQKNNSLCEFSFDVPAPAGALLDYILAPITNPGYSFLALNAQAQSINIAIPATMTGRNFIALPSWNSTVWISNQTGSVISLAFDTPAPPGSMLSYVFFPTALSANQTLSTGAHAISILYTPAKPTSAYQAFIQPTWDTTYSITKTGSGFTIVFSTPAPAGASINWGTFQM